jgi:hypothetical protein
MPSIRLRKRKAGEGIFIFPPMPRSYRIRLETWMVVVLLLLAAVLVRMACLAYLKQ